MVLGLNIGATRLVLVRVGARHVVDWWQEGVKRSVAK